MRWLGPLYTLNNAVISAHLTWGEWESDTLRGKTLGEWWVGRRRVNGLRLMVWGGERTKVLLCSGGKRWEVCEEGKWRAVHLYKPKNLSSVGSCFLRCSVKVVLTARTFPPSSMLQITLRKLCLWHYLGQGLLGNWQGHRGQVERETAEERQRMRERNQDRLNKTWFKMVINHKNEPEKKNTNGNCFDEHNMWQYLNYTYIHIFQKVDSN